MMTIIETFLSYAAVFMLGLPVTAMILIYLGQIYDIFSDKFNAFLYEDED